MSTSRADAFERLMRVVERLRGPDGCPWDRQQTHHSLSPYLVEEAYELLAALQQATEKPHRVREELGDLLLQVLLHSVIAAERGAFTITDVLVGLEEKLIRRHPHVFGAAQAMDASDVERNWEAIKEAERRARGEPTATSRFVDIPEGLPPLARAYRLQQRVAAVGFDWDEPVAALQKAREELDELHRALVQGTAGDVREEAGDALFALVNVIRRAGYDPDAVLAAANEKFIRRFQALEEEARRRGRDLTTMTLEEMDALWEQVKHAENG